MPRRLASTLTAAALGLSVLPACAGGQPTWGARPSTRPGTASTPTATPPSREVPAPAPAPAPPPTNQPVAPPIVRVAMPDAPAPAALAPRVDSLLARAIEAHAFPGASVAAGVRGDARLVRAYGRFTYDPSSPRVETASLFDLASLTKVVATTTAAMRLVDRGQLDLEAPLSRYLPELTATNKRAVTVRQVMTHSAGLRPFIPFHTRGVTTRDALLAGIYADSLVYTPGAESRYSDFGFILLGLAIERVTGVPLDQFCARDLWGPLGMTQTHFRPVGRVAGSDAVVPTEVDNLYRRRLVQGEVHDETAWTLGGVAGHAGLFSTADDLARFAAMLATGGRLPDGTVFVRPETFRLFTTRDGQVRGSTRAIGWDTRSDAGYSSAGTKFGPRAFGHTGFTGTSLWVDPDRGLWVVLLANRVYPTRDNTRHSPVRSALADIVYDEVR